MSRIGISRRAVVTFAAALSMGAFGSAAVAHAETVPSGVHTWSGDVYDGLGGGRSGSQTSAEAIAFDVYASSDHRAVSVTVFENADALWSLDFVAPEGHVLAEGRYEGALHPVRAAAHSPQSPGLNVTTPWGSSDDITGAFTVTDVVFGEGQKVESFEVSYVQYREGFAPLAGELSFG
jgi:hypothetical protein